MKVLCVDTQNSGHHPKYYISLQENIKDFDIVGMFPESYDDNKIGQYALKKRKDGFSITGYISFLYQVMSLCKCEKVEAIHFLYADYLVRYFGLFLDIFSGKSLIGTFHHIKGGILREFALKRICKRLTSCVVHTSSLKIKLNEMGIENVTHIEYPVFLDESQGSSLPQNINNLKKIKIAKSC